MKRFVSILAILLLIPFYLFATHNRAGEITVRHVSGYTYEITVTTFTYTLSAANRNQLDVWWGDNSQSIVNLNRLPDGHYDRIELPNYYFRNKYTTTHTFPGPGIYQILMQDPNRNYGIKNIPNSVNVIFSIKTVLIISPEIGNNSTPLLLNYPIDKAARGHIFIHNPSAYDPDGDSLSYKLTVCTGQDGKPISDYKLPTYSDTIYVDPVKGDLVWNTPVDTGKYNVAMNIEEWRYGVKIGNITRDMQINVYETDNNPPVNPPLTDFCIEAGSIIEFQVTTTDADNDSVKQTMTGGPFVTKSSPATFKRVARGLGFSTSTFKWQTNCDHIRKQPWQVTLKSEDVNKDISLIDIDNFTIRVLAPAPKNLTSKATSTEIDLSWQQHDCGSVAGYYIYRREGSFAFNHDSCENGVPPYTGFIKIGKTDVKADTVFTDDNHGEGLVQGISYCYMVTAYYNDGSESFASEEICNSLVPGFPALLNVSVTKIDAVTGSIFIAWAKPRDFNVASAPGPYVFRIYRSETPNPNNFLLIDSVQTADLNDTTFVDSLLNTIKFPYYYTVKMFNNTPGNRFEMRPGENEIASSLYIEIVPNDNQLTLNIRKKAPWINDQYIIYRKYATFGFDSIATVNTYQFVDTGLKNGETYYYQATSIGWRPIDGKIFNNSNKSHENYGTPVDISPPCAPILYIDSQCDSLLNVLTWTNPNKTCANDVVRYNIYYAPGMGAALDSLTSISPATDTVFYHRISEGVNLAGCYAVSAVDSFGNESALSAYYCVDKCPLYQLPNVFTPNGDSNNDFFLSNNLNHIVEKVDMKIFNRYGLLVYETNDPDINWNGKFRNTNNKVPSGVYYYICDVYEPRISGTEIRTLVGFIHVYAEGNAEIITK
jgi:gliding motility-associated-like protein